MHDCVPFAFGDGHIDPPPSSVELSMHVALCVCMLSSPRCLRASTRRFRLRSQGMAERPETSAVAIDFRDAVKAQITQAVLAALLERCGYRITRLGIEELFREVKFKELAQYREMG